MTLCKFTETITAGWQTMACDTTCCKQQFLF